MPVSAKVICASLSPYYDKPLVTFKLRHPKFIHGECKTHRQLRMGDEGGIEYELWQEIGFMDDPHLSRNASSSRAVPTARLIAEARGDDTRAEPAFWGAEQKGMSPGAELDDTVKSMQWLDRFDLAGDRHTGEMVTPKEYVRRVWKYSALDAADRAELMMKAGAHKSIVNRVLDPYTHYNVVCTATEYDNFFGLRLDKAADPTMHALAEAMWREYNECKPLPCLPGDWHLPLVDESDMRDIRAMHGYDATGRYSPGFDTDEVLIVARKVSTARCARTSYTSFETGRRSTIAEDIALHDRLVVQQPLHATPAEHQATPDKVRDNPLAPVNPVPFPDAAPGTRWNSWRIWSKPELHGNFVGWCQHRKMLPGEACAPLPAEYRR